MRFLRKIKAQTNVILLYLINIIKSFLNFHFASTLVDMKLKKNIGEGKSFNEKLSKKMYFDKNPLLTLVADKLSVREYVENRIGSKYLSKLYFFDSTANEVPWDSLPNSFVIKVNHASGGIILVCGCESKHDTLPFNIVGNIWPRFLISREESRDYRSLNRILNHWLRNSYYRIPNKLAEYAYKDIVPKFFIEEFLETSNREIPSDYKFFCFHGECKIVQVDSERFKVHTRDMFDLDWNLLPFTFTYPNSAIIPTRPKSFEEMIRIAESLSEGFDFIRVDLYNINGRIVFGELTNYPEGSLGKFSSREWDEILGSFW
jgi:hypothetical protein